MKALPKNLIADTLNTRFRKVERSHSNTHVIPRLHVSSLIKSGPQDAFCPREFVLRYIEHTDELGAGIPPKFELLYAVGHFYGEFIVNQFLRRNPDWAQYAWGDWTCRNRCTRIEKISKWEADNQSCLECGSPLDHYLETDLINPKGTVVGHADLIFNVEGHFYVYEFKSIDRSDVVFEEINDPLGDHLLQASNYYYMLKWMLKDTNSKVSKRIRFVYVDRSMAGLYTQLPYREVEGDAVRLRRLHNIYDRAQACHTAIEKGVLPERICDSITCSRAKQCSKAISCFYRAKTKVRVPTPSD